MRKSKARYSKVARRMWNDAKFRRLSAPEPNAQTLWMRLLTGPELTAIPGLIPTGEAGMAEALGWSLKAFREAFREVFREGLAEADYQARLIFVPGAIQYNAPASPNVVLAWAETWDELPECELKDKAHAHLHDFLSSIGDKWLEAFEEACGKPSPKPYGKPYGKACPNQEQEQEQEVKRDTSYLLSIRDPNGPPAPEPESVASPPIPEPAAPKPPSRKPPAVTADQRNAVAAEWNRIVDAAKAPLRRCRGDRFPESSLAKLRARIAESGGWDPFTCEFSDRAARIANSPWHCGENERGWKADLPWLLEPGGWAKAARQPHPSEARASPKADGRYRKLTQVERDFLRTEGKTDDEIEEIEKGLTNDRSIFGTAIGADGNAGGLRLLAAPQSGESGSCPALRDGA